MIESLADCKVVVRYADKACMLSEKFTWANQKMRWVSRRPRIVLCVIPRWMDSKRDNSGRWFVRDSPPIGARLRASPQLSKNVRVCKHKVETNQSGERRGDPSRFNITTASSTDKG